MNEYDFKIKTGKLYQEFKKTINKAVDLTKEKKQEIINRARKRLFNV